MYGRSERAANQAGDKLGRASLTRSLLPVILLKNKHASDKSLLLRLGGLYKACSEALFVSIQRENRQEKTHIDDWEG